ncbi:MAG: helix-turn-helix transcriptional regulator [gamma proteobacterium symbiont of Taylorina sp.]|nr:helix-turn-helix transcriptional regulator [gamma proteobacterium symbiont of Taylorina sp.]
MNREIEQKYTPPVWAPIAKKRMRKVGLKQKDLVEVFNVASDSSVGHYFRGRRNASIIQVVALADCLDLSMDELMDRTVVHGNANISSQPSMISGAGTVKVPTEIASGGGDIVDSFEITPDQEHILEFTSRPENKEFTIGLIKIINSTSKNKTVKNITNISDRVQDKHNSK